MKTTATVTLATVGLGIALLVGCSTTPTSLDRAVANVQTNYTAVLALQTNLITVVQTNTVVQTVTVTNSVGIPVPVYQTNYVVASSTTTNVLLITNQVPSYTLTPSTTSTTVAAVAGAGANLVSPGLGGMVTSGLLGLLSVYLGFRNRKMNGQNDALSQSAGVLAQIIETGREVMAAGPQGQAAANAFTQWMVTHQAQTDTIGEITTLVKGATNNVQAQAAANQILALIGQSPAPTAPVPPAKVA